MLCNTDVICYFSVAMKIVYGKLGAICVVTSQLGFERPFSIRFFARNVVPTVIYTTKQNITQRRTKEKPQCHRQNKKQSRVKGHRERDRIPPQEQKGDPNMRESKQTYIREEQRTNDTQEQNRQTSRKGPVSPT